MPLRVLASNGRKQRTHTHTHMSRASIQLWLSSAVCLPSTSLPVHVGHPRLSRHAVCIQDSVPSGLRPPKRCGVGRARAGGGQATAPVLGCWAASAGNPRRGGTFQSPPRRRSHARGGAPARGAPCRTWPPRGAPPRVPWMRCMSAWIPHIVYLRARACACRCWRAEMARAPAGHLPSTLNPTPWGRLTGCAGRRASRAYCPRAHSCG